MKRHLSVLILLVIALLGAGTLVWAQEETPPVLPPAQQPQMQQAPQQVLSPQQLNNLVAPIALYPDPLLGQLLVASTYPLEIVEANQWLQRNKNLSGQAAHGRRKAAILGSQRASAGGRSGCAGDAKPGYSLDHRPWQRLPRATGRRDERGPADARPGARQWQPFFDAAADGHD